MTILDALERAKRMRAERGGQPNQGELDGGRPAKPAARSAQAKVLRRMGSAADLPPAPQLPIEQLPIYPEIYEKNRVLMSREQGHAYSAVVDSYRILRTRLSYRRAPDAGNWSSFGMVSAGPGEGKSVTCLNLALAFAREKKQNVFLLDLDLRNPSICRYLGVTPTVEIGAALTRSAQPKDIFFGVGVENFIVAGGMTSFENSSELLGGAGLDAVFDYIAEVDPKALIFVDLPPLLISADSLVVAPKLSAVVLVVGEGVTRREHLDRAVELLGGATVAGIVLNRSKEQVEDYYS